jgi:formyltetrahydrofolate deformylase
MTETQTPRRSSPPEYILTLSCQDRPGIVAAISGALAAEGCNIEESSQFGDPETKQFFMRVRFSSPSGLPRDAVEDALRPPTRRFAMSLSLHDAAHKARVTILVSKFDHCLRDLLYRAEIGALPANIVRVISNHPVCRGVTEHAGLPFQHLPVTPENRPQQEEQLRAAFEKDRTELVVLARYMQILSPELAESRFGAIINIHHSFLPGFKGAKPYHRAHARGVKIIGATAHYVTADLDEGPIIEQETERVNHAMTVNDLVAAGQDIERRVLARAVKLHVERRVLINGPKTVVFR